MCYETYQNSSSYVNGIHVHESEKPMTKTAKRIRNILQVAVVTLTMLAPMILAGCTSSVMQVGVIGDPVIPIMLQYTPAQREQLVGKYETKQFTLNSKGWEEWKNPTLDVTFRLKKGGDIQIRECEVSVEPSNSDNYPVFVVMETKTEIKCNQIKIVLTGYTDFGYKQEEEQIIAFVVRFVPTFLGGTDLNQL